MFKALHGNPSLRRLAPLSFVQRRMALRAQKLATGGYGPPAAKAAKTEPDTGPQADPEQGAQPQGSVPPPDSGQPTGQDGTGGAPGPVARWVRRLGKATAHATVDGQTALCGVGLSEDVEVAPEDTKRCANCAKHS